MSLCVKELSSGSGSTADEIYNCVLQALDETDLDINKLCALAIDGASVMTLGYTGPHWDFFKARSSSYNHMLLRKTKDSLPFMEQFLLTLVRLRMNTPFEMSQA